MCCLCMFVCPCTQLAFMPLQFQYAHCTCFHAAQVLALYLLSCGPCAASTKYCTLYSITCCSSYCMSTVLTSFCWYLHNLVPGHTCVIVSLHPAHSRISFCFEPPSWSSSICPVCIYTESRVFVLEQTQGLTRRPVHTADILDLLCGHWAGRVEGNLDLRFGHLAVQLQDYLELRCGHWALQRTAGAGTGSRCASAL